MPQSQTNEKKKSGFKPKMKNFKTSLSYEGLTLKDSDKDLTIDELKRLYAR
ncbi:hypothetical protein JQC92_18185 [Shewanella sp. 202IG2-18]|uniref:hypothetical protein n=1 Tax=Parashewanella hymeniacidonis TaxID=2807618 RepID=UPI00195FB65A|nr:hypothetical protein [Parashewanella hymeniacidonis]MBM7073939.1 hypothetical protein [Parashewanella hymeniacidonis]